VFLAGRASPFARRCCDSGGRARAPCDFFAALIVRALDE
jgi:hypothetical protein